MFHLLQHIAVERHAGAVHSAVQVAFDKQYSFVPESRIEMVEISKCADKEPSSKEQHERNGNLPRDQNG